ncbi:glycosyltransferase [Sinomonas mesophila]|uniref:glycosyltransferase n=1 Tax=Sinomonas mesophila TaxID=1531955 RepID=UPI0009879849|nr:glycosyltransferase [Sinomonas mesophila]
MSPAPRVVAVVVSFNRRELLARTLAGIAGGELRPDAVVVVDNASSDGSADMVRGLGLGLELDLVELGTNVGGAGGFTVGIERAVLDHAADLVWVMDDDTEPQPGTLAAAVRAWTDYAPAPEQRPTVVASRVLWTDGREHPMNTMVEWFAATPAQRRRAAAVGAMPIRSASYVSCLLSADAVRELGLPIADYFLWADDFEHTTRLARFNDAIQAPESVVVHHTKKFGTTDVDPGPRFYYEVRNRFWTYGRSQSLAPWERLAFTYATGRIWVRTFANSSDRGVLVRCLVRGALDGLRAPRPNAEVLAGVYPLRPVPQVARTSSDRAEAPLPFSLLMAVYDGDTPERFRRALASSTREQARPPAEAVIVRDGPVGAELQAALDDAAAIAGPGTSVRVLELADNVGLTAALGLGLAECTHAVVARADADDVSLPRRFAAQLPVIEAGADLVGSAMEEIGDDEDTVVAHRAVPTAPSVITRTAHARNPFNHPTVVFRRAAVDAVGGYQEVPGAEDWWLWARMIAAGADVRNLAEPLVRYRVSGGAYERRGGLRAFRGDLVVQAQLRAGGFVGPGQWLRNVAVRAVYRFLPTAVRARRYRRMVAPR